MNRKSLFLILTLILTVVILSACERPIPLPQGVSTATSAGPGFPVGTVPPVVQELLSATQTAMAEHPDEPTASAGEDKPTPTAKPTKKPASASTAEATKTKVTVPTETPGKPSTYILQYGEWPICIARRFNVDIDEFFAVNHLNMQSRLLAGTPLYIPATSGWDTRYGARYWHPHPADYTVAPGDNINKIACFYGDVSPEAILAANGLSGSYTLNVGQVLDIP